MSVPGRVLMQKLPTYDRPILKEHENVYTYKAIAQLGQHCPVVQTLQFVSLDDLACLAGRDKGEGLVLREPMFLEVSLWTDREGRKLLLFSDALAAGSG